MRITHSRLVSQTATCRLKSKIRPPPPASAVPIIRVSNNIARLGQPIQDPKPRQLLSLPPFPGNPLPGRNSTAKEHVTALSWLQYYFKDIPPPVIQDHFKKGLVQIECLDSGNSVGDCTGISRSLEKIGRNYIMEVGSRVHVPVTVAESKPMKRFDVIPTGTDNPNADEIQYLQRLVNYKDSAILVLNKPPKFPLKGDLSVHNSMDAMAAAALSYDFAEGPKLVHRFDRESSGLLLMGRTKESIAHLQWLFSDTTKVKPLSKEWNDACDAMYQRYWALVIGSPKQKEGLISAPLSKLLLDDGETERIILANDSGMESSQPAVTEYRVLGPTINGCSWIELRPHTRCKHQLRVHCAEALGTPIVGDYRYSWFVHSRWKQMPRVDYEPTTGAPYKLRRPEGLQVQKGSVLSKVPLLHLHCREMVLPNIAKFIQLHKRKQVKHDSAASLQDSKPDLLRFVAEMPFHMKTSWSLMASYLV